MLGGDELYYRMQVLPGGQGCQGLPLPRRVLVVEHRGERGTVLCCDLHSGGEEGEEEEQAGGR